MSTNNQKQDQKKEEDKIDDDDDILKQLLQKKKEFLNHEVEQKLCQESNKQIEENYDRDDDDDNEEDDENNEEDVIELIPLDVDNYTLDKLLVIGTVHFNMLARVSQYKVYAPKSQQKQLEDDEDRKNISEQVLRFYKKRKTLFSKIDQGIKLDEESWYSVTPEGIAKYLAKRLTCKTIFDGLCGVGGNAIQFGFTCEKVIANDIDPVKIEYAKNNSNIYGVQNKITFLNEDILNMKTKVSADIVFLSPPWGGVEYLKENYDLLNDIKPNIVETIKVALSITQNIVMLLPKNTIINQIAIVICKAFEESKIPSERCGIEIEKLYLGNQFKFIAVYFGYNARKLHIHDEMGYIFKILNDYQQDQFKYKKLIRIIQRRFGMIKLLDFIFQCQKVKNIKQLNRKMIDKFIDYLLTQNIITNEELQKLTQQKLDQETEDQEEEELEELEGVEQKSDLKQENVENKTNISPKKKLENKNKKIKLNE